jgi:hypothetical protein
MRPRWYRNKYFDPNNAPNTFSRTLSILIKREQYRHFRGASCHSMTTHVMKFFRSDLETMQGQRSNCSYPA